MLRTVEDQDLVGQAVRGSKEAFSSLIRLHQLAVRGFVARYIRDREAIDDLAQEIFFAAHKSLASYRGDAPFRHWLLGIGRRHVINHLRARSRHRESPHPAIEEAVVGWQLGMVDTDERQLIQLDGELAALQGCLQRLDPRNAEMVNAYYFEAKSAAEIGQKLGKKEPAVRMALMRIRQALRTCMSRHADAGSA
jgi:RNA polymerase sigma-70 factor (ECF subfamily)